MVTISSALGLDACLMTALRQRADCPLPAQNTRLKSQHQICVIGADGDREGTPSHSQALSRNENHPAQRLSTRRPKLWLIAFLELNAITLRVGKVDGKAMSLRTEPSLRRINGDTERAKMRP